MSVIRGFGVLFRRRFFRVASGKELALSTNMKVPKHILVPTDFSKPATKALDLAIDVATKLGARVTVLHAYEFPIMGFPDGAFVPTSDIASRIMDSAEKALDRTVAAQKHDGVDVKSILRNGEARETILATADEIGADLIVIGTHGRRGLAHVLLGSVAEYVVRTATQPVLTVRAAKE